MNINSQNLESELTLKNIFLLFYLESSDLISSFKQIESNEQAIIIKELTLILKKLSTSEDSILQNHKTKSQSLSEIDLSTK